MSRASKKLNTAILFISDYLHWLQGNSISSNSISSSKYLPYQLLFIRRIISVRCFFFTRLFLHLCKSTLPTFLSTFVNTGIKYTNQVTHFGNTGCWYHYHRLHSNMFIYNLNVLQTYWLYPSKSMSTNRIFSGKVLTLGFKNYSETSSVPFECNPWIFWFLIQSVLTRAFIS